MKTTSQNKVHTVMRDAVPAIVRLAATIRYLATGVTYTDLRCFRNFLFFSTSFNCTISVHVVYMTCEFNPILHTNVKPLHCIYNLQIPVYRILPIKPRGGGDFSTVPVKGGEYLKEGGLFEGGRLLLRIFI